MRFPALILTLAGIQALIPARADETADVAVLRNTVVNILEAMVQKGLISKDAADKLVADAQTKADRDAAARAAETAAQPGDVRVTYVPDIVKEEISKQVSADIEQKVSADVVARAQTEGWGVPGALPGWVRDAQWSGDVRLRVAPVFLSNGNAQNAYLNFQAINEAGGIQQAGSHALLDTTDDQVKYNARLRFGVETRLSNLATVGFRLATGDPDNPVSANAALDNYNNGYQVRVDEAYLRLGRDLEPGRHRVYLWGGRMRPPFDQTELVWDPDLRFNGFAAQYVWNDGAGPRGLFANAGFFPLQGVDVSSKDKWLAGAQVGYEWAWADTATFTMASAYYNYGNETGQANPPGSTEFNYTAPPFVQKGNTLFDISDPASNSDLYALGAEYGLLDLTGKAAFVLTPELQLAVSGDFVTNLAYSESDVFARTGVLVPKRANGWRGEVRLGTPRVDVFGGWSVGLAYTYLERDAVLDGFADSDFHGGGTDAQGYTLAGEFGITRNTWMRMRYMSANEIDGPPLAVDILLLDLNAAF